MKLRLDGLRVLVVEDDSDLRGVVGDFFGAKGALVSRVANGQEAWAIIEGGDQIDFVLSDVQMPVLDGIALLKRIRDRHPKLPLVLLATGQSTLTEEGAKELGAAGLLHKPFDFKTLEQTLRRVLAPKLPP